MVNRDCIPRGGAPALIRAVLSVHMREREGGMEGKAKIVFPVVITAIIVFIVVGIGLITGLSPRPAVGIHNLVAWGGFLPHGWLGMWLAR